LKNRFNFEEVIDADEDSKKDIFKRALEEMKGPGAHKKKPVDIEAWRKKKGKKTKSKRKGCGCK